MLWEKLTEPNFSYIYIKCIIFSTYFHPQMVVPKRAALLLDRLMVALHHALEQERGGHRIGEFYSDKSILNGKLSDLHNGLEPHQIREDGESQIKPLPSYLS